MCAIQGVMRREVIDKSPGSFHDAVDGSSTGTRVLWMWALLGSHDSEELTMQTMTTIGLDIAKSVPAME
jgi:hypothetical protein